MANANTATIKAAGFTFVKTCSCGSGKWVKGSNTIKFFPNGFKLNADKKIIGYDKLQETLDGL